MGISRKVVAILDVGEFTTTVLKSGEFKGEEQIQYLKDYMNTLIATEQEARENKNNFQALLGNLGLNPETFEIPHYVGIDLEEFLPYNEAILAAQYMINYSLSPITHHLGCLLNHVNENSKEDINKALKSMLIAVK